MKHNILPGGADRVIHHLRKIGKTGVALLLAVTMILGALPYGGAYSAYAESGASDVSSDVSADPRIDGAVEESQTTTTTNTTTVTTSSAEESTATTTVAATTSSAMSTISSEAQTTAAATTTTTAANINAVFPLVSGSDSVSSDNEQPAETTSTTVPNINVVLPLVSSSDVISGSDISNSDVEKHVCVIHGFEGYIPGVALTVISLESVPENGAEALLPRTLTGIMGCEECSDVVNVEWVKEGSSENGADVYRVKLDEERYSYVVLDDPKTKEIDESNTSPYCDLPYVEIVVKNVSNSDVTDDNEIVTGSDVVPEPVVSGGDAEEAPIVSGTDVAPDNDDGNISGAGSEDVVTNTDVASDSDVVSESDAEPVCTCVVHCYASVEDGTYLVDIKCAVCSADPSGCTVDPILEESSIKAVTEDGRVVTVTGEFPENAVLRVELLSEEELAPIVRNAGLLGEPIVHFAYDITILYEGREFQPSDFGNTVKVSVSDIDIEENDGILVIHAAEEVTERVDASVEDGKTTFETDSFSAYVALSTDISDIYYKNGYFYKDVACSEMLCATAEDSSTAYTRMSAILNATTGGLTFHMLSAYSVSWTEMVDPGDSRTVSIKASGYTGSLVEVVNAGNLTLRSITIDGAGTTETAALVKIQSGGTLTMGSGAKISGGNHRGVSVSGSFYMNDGEISGCSTSDSGGAVEVIGTFEMRGGVITGNQGVNGGAIDNKGNLIITGGVISNNTATGNSSGSGNGGAIYNYYSSSNKGVATIGGTAVITGNTAKANGGAIYFFTGSNLSIIGQAEISGNKSNSTSAYRNGIYASMTSGSGYTNITMDGSPNIQDPIYCEFDGKTSQQIAVKSTFNPVSAVKMAGVSGNHMVYSVSEITPEVFSKFTSADPAYTLIIGNSNHYIKLLGGLIAYYGGDVVRTDSAAYNSPNTWSLELSGAYRYLKREGIYTANSGGTIYMADAYAVHGNGSHVYVRGNNFTNSNGTIVDVQNRVMLKRWQRPGSLGTESTWLGTILSVATNNYLTIENITIDGSNRPSQYAYNGTIYSLSGIASTNFASVAANGGTVNLLNGAALIDAPASPYGGAVLVQGGGTLNINGNVIFRNNKSTVGKAVYVANGKVNINSDFTNPGGDDIYLAGDSPATSALNINVALNNKVCVSINPSSTAACAENRVIATCASEAIALDLVNNGKIEVVNVSCNLKVVGKNIVIASNTRGLTAYAEETTPSEGASKSFTIDLAEMYGGIANVKGKAVTTDQTAGYALTDYSVVESNKRKYGMADSNKIFGVSVALVTDSGVVTTQDISSFSTTVPSTATSAKLVFTIHNGNAITEDGDIGNIDMSITLNGSVRKYKVNLYKESGQQISATVPLKITGVVDAMGNFTLPQGDNGYVIKNYSCLPLQVTDVSWTWYLEGTNDADEMFSNVKSLSMSVTLGGGLSFSNVESTLKQEVSNEYILAKNSDDEPGVLELDWSMSIGDNNYIKSIQSATIAKISYTIAVPNETPGV